MFIGFGKREISAGRLPGAALG